MNILDTINPPKTPLWRNKKVLIAAAVIIAVIIAATAIALKPKTINYQTITATTGDIISTISSTGTLNPTNEVLIGSVISGIVLEVRKDVNDEVKAGEIMARINPETINQQIARFSAQLGSMKAQLVSAEKNLADKTWQYENLAQVYEKSGGKTPSKLELLNAQSAMVSAQSDVKTRSASIEEVETSLKSAKIDLKNSEISSPIDGVVLSRSVEVGQSIAASFNAPELFRVAQNLEEMNLIVHISEADIGKVAVGKKVRFSVDAYPGRRFSAKINRINFGSKTVENIVSYETRIFVNNKDLALKPGMSATAEIIVDEARGVLSVPNSALFFNLEAAMAALGAKKKGGLGDVFGVDMGPGRPKRVIRGGASAKNEGSLWVLKDGAPVQVAVKLGLSDGKNVQILEGVTQNDQIIVGILEK